MSNQSNTGRTYSDYNDNDRHLAIITIIALLLGYLAIISPIYNVLPFMVSYTITGLLPIVCAVLLSSVNYNLFDALMMETLNLVGIAAGEKRLPDVGSYVREYKNVRIVTPVYNYSYA